MGKDSKIQWCHHTFNIVWGCVRFDECCFNCYAERLDARYHKNETHWGVNAPRLLLSENYWKQPLKWNDEAKNSGERLRVFSSSMADVFEDHPTVAGERKKLFPLIRKTPYLDWLLLTKRYNLVKESLPEDWSLENYPNVWLGQSIGKNKHAAKYLDEFLKNRARVLFLSMEPLLEYVDIKPWLSSGLISWVICGGESGNMTGKFRFRECKLEWISKIVDDCKQYDVPVFVKQFGTGIAKELGYEDSHGGDINAWPEELRIRELPKHVLTKAA